MSIVTTSTNAHPAPIAIYAHRAPAFNAEGVSAYPRAVTATAENYLYV